MKTNKKNFVPAEDLILFAKMLREAISDNERSFFENLSIDESTVPTICGQLYIHENDNDEGLFLIRRNGHEYELDNATVPEGVEAGGYYDSLSEVLSVYLDEIHICDEHITLLEWLRSRDYACVRYNHNFDAV